MNEESQGKIRYRSGKKKTFEIIPKTHDLQMLHVAYLSIECFLSGFDSNIMNFRA